MSQVINVSRRSFLKLGAAATSGLLLGVRLPAAACWRTTRSAVRAFATS